MGNTSNPEVHLRDIISGRTRLPLENKKAMVLLQGKDEVLKRVRDLLLAGQVPSPKRVQVGVRFFFRSDVKATIDKDNCLVVYKTNRHNLATRALVAVPENITNALLYSLHLNLNHPKYNQLPIAR